MDDEILTRMRGLIGRHFDYLGERWTLIEVLADDGTVVLCRANAATIQADQYGRANRRCAETMMVPILSDDGETLSSQLMELLASKG